MSELDRVAFLDERLALGGAQFRVSNSGGEVLKVSVCGSGVVT